MEFKSEAISNHVNENTIKTLNSSTVAKKPYSEGGLIRQHVHQICRWNVLITTVGAAFRELYSIQQWLYRLANC